MHKLLIAGAAIGANFALGLFLPLSGSGDQAVAFAIKACAVFSLLGLPFYAWACRKHDRWLLPILLFPNPFLADITALMIACASGGGCL